MRPLNHKDYVTILMNPEHKITWIASFPRSGNTWVRALISAYGNGGSIGINEVMQTGDKDPIYYDGIVKAPINEWSMMDQALLKPAAMLRMLEGAGGNLMLKTHDCNVDLSGITQIPHAVTRGAIYITRDPRDIALSFQNHYQTDNIDTAIDKMLDRNGMTRYPNKGLFVLQLSWQLHITSWLRELPYPVHVLRYEDLIEQPFATLGEIIKFLKLDYDAEIVRKSIDACQFDKLAHQEKTEGFRESVGQTFFYKGQANRWKTDLDESAQARIVNACEKEMKVLEYL